MDSVLLTAQRQSLIREWLARDGRVVAARLAQTFGVSEDTVRRDLRELAAGGHCRRVYGGALPFAPDGGSLTRRLASEPDRKRRLGEAVAALVEPGTTLFVDAGSTNLRVAETLPEGAGLRVVTNAPAIACALQDRSGIEVHLLGGRLDPVTGACTGTQTVRDAARFRPSLLVLGACGLDPDAGVTAHDLDEAELKSALAAGAREIVVAATLDKFGSAASYNVVPAAALTTLVAEHDCPAETLAPFAALGVRVVRAAPEDAAAPFRAPRAR